MKIIHTSDWHLGHRLYNYDRSEEESRFFEQLEQIVGDEKPDALLVSGDIYHTGAPGNDVAKVFTERLLDVQAKCPDMEIVVIAGNHDSYSRLEIDSSLWRRCHVHVLGTPAEDGNGRADFDRNVIEVPGKGLIAAVPFCHPRNFPVVGDGSEGDRMASYFKGLRQFVEERNQTKLPAVLMAHLAVGKETDLTGQDRKAIIGGEECVDSEVLGVGYDYIALGHIHCPQWVKGGRKVARYCGTPRAIHFDETYPHGVDVVTVEAGREAVVKTVEFEPLRPLKTLGGKSGKPFGELLKELGEVELKSETYVRLNVSLSKGEVVSVDWNERARKMAAERNVRFCLINPIYEIAAATSEASERLLTMQKLKELSNAEVLSILSCEYELSDRQKEMLGELMTKLDDVANG